MKPDFFQLPPGLYHQFRNVLPNMHRNACFNSLNRYFQGTSGLKILLPVYKLSFGYDSNLYYPIEMVYKIST